MIRGQLDIQLGRVDRQINPLKIKCPQFQSFSSEKAIAYRVLSYKISFSFHKIIHEKKVLYDQLFRVPVLSCFLFAEGVRAPKKIYI